MTNAIDMSVALQTASTGTLGNGIGLQLLVRVHRRAGTFGTDYGIFVQPPLIVTANHAIDSDEETNYFHGCIRTEREELLYSRSVGGQIRIVNVATTAVASCGYLDQWRERELHLSIGNK
jgi:hypothetical protein